MAAILGAGCLLTVVLGVVVVGGAGVALVYLGGDSGMAEFDALYDEYAAPMLEGGTGAGLATNPDVPAVSVMPVETPIDDGDAADTEPAAEGSELVVAPPAEEAAVEEPPPPVEEPVVEAPVEDDAAAAAGADETAAGSAPVTVEHTPTKMTVVGDSVTFRATTPGHDNCTLKLTYKAAGQSWRSLTMSRSGSSHTQILSVESSMSPSFDYYLVATDCGAGLWPADGSKQTVKVF